jgi:hypothetical protein
MTACDHAIHESCLVTFLRQQIKEGKIIKATPFTFTCGDLHDGSCNKRLTVTFENTNVGIDDASGSGDEKEFVETNDDVVEEGVREESVAMDHNGEDTACDGEDNVQEESPPPKKTSWCDSARHCCGAAKKFFDEHIPDRRQVRNVAFAALVGATAYGLSRYGNENQPANTSWWS